MDLEIRDLRKKDYKKLIQYTQIGMHLDWYYKNKLMMFFGGRYLFYYSMLKSTNIIAAYYNDEIAGAIMYAMKDGEEKYYTFWKSLYIKIINFIDSIFTNNGAELYHSINNELLENYEKEHMPDGEIVLFVANPNIKGKGTGTFLLNELQKLEPGKLIYLFTDTSCTYQFYEHRNFEKAGEKAASFGIGKDKKDILCFLYSRQF